jgi:hypothetical protein
MNDASAYLHSLARRVIAPYAEHPRIRAIILTGSAADDTADLHSDLDLIAYYDELPSDEELAAARQRNQGENFAWLFNERDDGTIAEAYDVRDVQCQVMHNTIPAWEAQMSSVLAQHEVGTPLHKAMSGIQKSIPLYGAELIQSWKDRVNAFPEPLARATVEHHLRFFPLWGLQSYMDRRDAVLWRYQALLEAAQNILGVLAGLNRLYYTTFQFKRMRLFTKQLAIAPRDLETRLEQLFEAEPQVAAAELERLVGELVALVEQHMPDVDTSSVRKRLGWRRPQWQIVNDDQL